MQVEQPPAAPAAACTKAAFWLPKGAEEPVLRPDLNATTQQEPDQDEEFVAQSEFAVGFGMKIRWARSTVLGLDRHSRFRREGKGYGRVADGADRRADTSHCRYQDDREFGSSRDRGVCVDLRKWLINLARKLGCCRKHLERRRACGSISAAARSAAATGFGSKTRRPRVNGTRREGEGRGRSTRPR